MAGAPGWVRYRAAVTTADLVVALNTLLCTRSGAGPVESTAPRQRQCLQVLLRTSVAGEKAREMNMAALVTYGNGSANVAYE